MFFLDQLLRGFSELDTATDLAVSEKPREGMGSELVSRVDREIEHAYSTFLLLRFPDAGVIGEEGHGVWPPEGSRAWIIDPLDGTHNALAGLPIYGTMCALVERGQTVFSALFLPAKQRLTHDGIYVAGKGEGAWQIRSEKAEENFRFKEQARRISVSSVRELRNAFVIFEGPTKKVLGSLLADQVKWVSRRHRQGVSCCWSGMLVASGGMYASGFDALISCDNKPWDHLPIALLVEEAGGRVTDFDGRPYSLENYSSLVFSNGLIHEQTLALYKGTKEH